MKISKRTKEVLSNVMEEFLFEPVNKITIENIKDYINYMTNIPKCFIEVRVKDINKILVGYYVSEFKYQEFILFYDL